MQELEIVKMVDFGAYLAPDKAHEEEKILLPVKYVPQGSSVGTKIKVFVYKDSQDRMIASTKRPNLVMNEVAILKVAEVSKIGAFLDWGLEKDLLLPFKQQTKKVKQGEEVLVSLYIDKSERLCATMNVYKNLENKSHYKKDDQVKGRVYEISDNFGAFVAVDLIYSALIPKKELYGQVEVGQDIEARVIKVNEDGRLVLGIRQKAYLQIGEDSEKVLQILKEYEGVLPFNDKASPEVIKHETGMSKNEFKRAVGHLLKEGKITIGEKSIRLVK